MGAWFACSPSGCGSKTTTLRLDRRLRRAVGRRDPRRQQLLSSPARTVPPERRNMSMIFQSYALWPAL